MSKKKNRMKPLNDEELRQVGSMPVSALRISERVAANLRAKGFKTVGDVAKKRPNKLITTCLIGQGDVLLLGARLIALYKGSLPSWWSRKSLRREVLKIRPAPRLPPPPNIEGGVYSRFLHRGSTGKHYKKPRRGGLS
jgi:hypothetical protein